MDPQETTRLLRRAKDGEPDAVNALYGRVAGKLLALIRLRLGRSLRSQVESTDILQLTLLKSFEHLEQFEQIDGASLMAWLAKIAENEIRDRVDYQNRRRRDVRLQVPLETAHAGVAAAMRSALTQILIDERAERLEEALESLEPHYREVIVLRSYEELTFPEIGARLGKSEDACRMLFARAMAALTMRMSAHAAGPGA